MKPLLRKGSLKLNKLIHHLIRLHGEFENLCFASVAPMVSVSHTFVYEVVDVNKIVAVFSVKLPSYAYAQVTAGLKLYLG